MLHRLILKVTKFQLPPPKRLSTMVKNILGGPSCHPPCQIGLREFDFIRDLCAGNRCAGGSPQVGQVKIAEAVLRSKKFSKSFLRMANLFQAFFSEKLSTYWT